MQGKSFHIIYFESNGHRARLTIKESSMDMFLDLMLERKDLKIISDKIYYNNLPDVRKVACKILRKKNLKVGSCEEYKCI
jgi:hypothetical protein